LIQRIEDADGTILFEAKPKTTQVSNYVSGVLLSNILHNVVEHGTGRRAKGITTQDGVQIPVLGKTGTTNGYKNAAFVGMVPKAEAGQWSVENGVTIATYVGYDQPKSMKFGRLRLSGASGALPVWMETVKGVGLSTFIGQPRSGMTFSAPEDFGFHSVSVDAKTGSIQAEGTGRIWIYDPNAMWGQDGNHVRAFSPVDANEVPGWLEINAASGTDQVLPDDSIEDVRVTPEVQREVDNSSEVQEDSGILEERIVPQ
jgi:membrane peptidoglycan carboxypeptidase